jgi:hypothetical protein
MGGPTDRRQAGQAEVAADAAGDEPQISETENSRKRSGHSRFRKKIQFISKLAMSIKDYNAPLFQSF